VRFLVDRCAGARLARWLRELGHDVTDCGSLGTDPGDEALLQVAINEDRILVTIDQDFGQLLFVDRRPHRGLVRLPDCPANERIAIFLELLAKHSEALARRAVITVRGGRVRISWTPTPE
jgi:predicted nuclease of predicted toxin-antitoxin system